jgi:hypothetical protein
MPSLSDGVGSALRRGVRGLRRRVFPYSDYSQTIPPEIVDDEFYEVMVSLGRTAEVDTVLEIGSSTGEGSTRALVQGLKDNPRHPRLFCMELSRPRFEQLVARYGGDPLIRCYNVTSVPLDRFPTEAQVIDFYQTQESRLNRVPLSEVLRWLRQDVRYVGRLGAGQNGIRMIKEENGVENFGIVLIDGSEFTGPAELDEVYGAEYILLDDIGTYKNLANFERLRHDSAYRLAAANSELRNGYAVFERSDHATRLVEPAAVATAR